MSYPDVMPQAKRPVDADTIGEFCRALRERTGKSQRTLGGEYGINYITIARAETNDITRPMEYLRALKPLMTEREIDHMFDLLRVLDIKEFSGSDEGTDQKKEQSSAPRDSVKRPPSESAPSPQRGRTLVRKRPTR